MPAQRTVLVVEDHPELRQVLKAALASEGYEVVLAQDVDEAREKLRSGTFHLLIADLNDPRAKPVEVTEHLRNEFPELPGVVISSDDRLDPQVHFRASEGDNWRALPAPFRLSDLLSASKSAIG